MKSKMNKKESSNNWKKDNNESFSNSSIMHNGFQHDELINDLEMLENHKQKIRELKNSARTNLLLGLFSIIPIIVIFISNPISLTFIKPENLTQSIPSLLSNFICLIMLRPTFFFLRAYEKKSDDLKVARSKYEELRSKLIVLRIAIVLNDKVILSKVLIEFSKADEKNESTTEDSTSKLDNNNSDDENLKTILQKIMEYFSRNHQ